MAESVSLKFDDAIIRGLGFRDQRIRNRLLDRMQIDNNAFNRNQILRQNQMQDQEQKLKVAGLIGSVVKDASSLEEAEQLYNSSVAQIAESGYDVSQFEQFSPELLPSIAAGYRMAVKAGFVSGDAKAEPIRTTVKPGDKVIDEYGKVIYQSDKKDTSKTQPLVKDLRSRYDKFTADLRDVDAAYRKVASAPESAAGDMSLIFGYMKLLDPGSTVREGEFATAEQATGVGQQVINMYNKVLTGERLNPAQRADFKATAEAAFKAQQQSADEQIENLLFQADADGIPRANVLGKKALDDFNQRKSQAKKPEASPPPSLDPAIWEAMTPEERALF